MQNITTNLLLKEVLSRMAHRDNLARVQFILPLLDRLPRKHITLRTCSMFRLSLTA